MHFLLRLGLAGFALLPTPGISQTVRSALEAKELCRTFFTAIVEPAHSELALEPTLFDLGDWETTRAWIQKALGTHDPLELYSPPTLPTSGARIYLIKSPSRQRPVAALKVYQTEEELRREVTAQKGIENLRMRFTEVVPILAEGTAGSLRLPALLKEYSPNYDFDARLRALARENNPKKRQEAKDRYLSGLDAVAFSMKEFHSRSQKLGWKDFETQEFKDHELSRLEEGIRALDPGTPLQSHLLKGGVTTDQMQRIQSALSKAHEPYRNFIIENPSLIYADAHPGNFTFEMFSGEVGVFDLERAYYFIEGQHAADPLQDIARFAAGTLVTAIDAGLSIAEAMGLRNHLYSQFFQTKEELEKALPSLWFHELRFFSIVLYEGVRKGVKKNSDSTRVKLSQWLAKNSTNPYRIYDLPHFQPEPMPGLEHWAQYDRDYQSTMHEMIEANRQSFDEALRLDERSLRYAETTWGFRFSGEVHVPTMSEIAAKQHEYLQQNGYNPDALRMARVYLLPDGEEIWRQFGAPVPRNARPYDGYPVVPNKLALKMFVRKYFLAAENLPFRNSKVKAAKITISAHDSLGHHTTFALNPNFASAMIHGAIRYLTDSDLEELGNPIQRWAHFFEIGDLIDAKDRPMLLKTLHYPELPKDQVHYAWRSVEKALRDQFKTQPALKNYAAQVIDFFGRTVNSFGGALADQVQWRVRFREYGDRADLRPNQSLRWLATQLENSLNLTDSTTDEIYERLAKLQTAMIESTHLTPANWVDQAMRSKVDHASALYQYICKGGYFTAGTQFFNAYCE